MTPRRCFACGAPGTLYLTPPSEAGMSTGAFAFCARCRPAGWRTLSEVKHEETPMEPGFRWTGE